MRMFYEHTKTHQIYTSYEAIGKVLNISTAWVHKQMKDKKLPFRKVTEREVLRRASANPSRKSA